MYHLLFSSTTTQVEGTSTCTTKDVPSNVLRQSSQAVSPLNLLSKGRRDEKITHFYFLQNFHLQKNKVLKPKFRKLFGESFCKEKQWAMVKKDLKEICVFWILVKCVPRSCFYRPFMLLDQVASE